jgi:GrpB-like predicted nucleotidyltransferase (UPF0157 family)
MSVRIEIVDYDSEWPAVYRTQELRIRAALQERALAIEHVGSTAVPGLAAKPVIDIHLAVHDSADEDAYAHDLERVEYRLTVREPDWFEHRMFKAQAPEVNLHVFSQGCPELDRCRAFRDWLRISSSDRALYAATKSRLSAHVWDRVQDYADAKHDVIEEIMGRALRTSHRAGMDR